MNDDETTLLKVIGDQVVGPRHRIMLHADRPTVELVGALVEEGLVESTGYT